MNLLYWTGIAVGLLLCGLWASSLWLITGGVLAFALAITGEKWLKDGKG